MFINSGKITDYMGIDKMVSSTSPIVAIATTAGTGSEVTKSTIVADVEKDVKLLIGSAYIMPTIAANDPLLSMTVPQKTTATTGIDAFCHAVEALGKLCHDINIPSILGLGIDKEKFLSLTPKMAEDALNSRSPANTPRKTTKEEIIEINKKAL